MSKTRPLSPTLQELAITELNENPEKINEEIQCVRKWVMEEPTLGKYQLSDQFILSFLRCCKYNHETLRKKLKNYLTMETLCPEILANRRVNEEMMDLIRTGYHLVLPIPMEDQSRICMSQYDTFDLKQFTTYQGIKLVYMMLEVNFLEDDNTAIGGITCIEDMRAVGVGHILSMNWLVLKRILDFVRCGMPHRIKGVHLVCPPWYASGILTFTRSLLPTKLKSRFFIHKKLEDLYKYVPQRLLPAEHGGEVDTTEDLIKFWSKKMLQYRDYFEHDLQFGTGYEHEV